MTPDEKRRIAHIMTALLPSIVIGDFRKEVDGLALKLREEADQEDQKPDFGPCPECGEPEVSGGGADGLTGELVIGWICGHTHRFKEGEKSGNTA